MDEGGVVEEVRFRYLEFGFRSSSITRLITPMTLAPTYLVTISSSARHPPKESLKLGEKDY